MNIAVFASHGGSDLQAIIDGCKQDKLNATVAVGAFGARIVKVMRALSCASVAGMTATPPARNVGL